MRRLRRTVVAALAAYTVTRWVLDYVPLPDAARPVALLLVGLPLCYCMTILLEE